MIIILFTVAHICNAQIFFSSAQHTFLSAQMYFSVCTGKKYLALHIWATVIISKKMFLKNCGNKSIKSHFPIFSELSLS